MAPASLGQRVDLRSPPRGSGCWVVEWVEASLEVGEAKCLARVGSEYELGVAPSQDASDHQDYHNIFRIGDSYKSSFGTVTGRGPHPKYEWEHETRPHKIGWLGNYWNCRWAPWKKRPLKALLLGHSWYSRSLQKRESEDSNFQTNCWKGLSAWKLWSIHVSTTLGNDKKKPESEFDPKNCTRVRWAHVSGGGFCLRRRFPDQSLEEGLVVETQERRSTRAICVSSCRPRSALVKNFPRWIQARHCNPMQRLSGKCLSSMA